MAKELELKYGCNPNQKPSRIFMADGSELPIEVLNGKPGYLGSQGKTVKNKFFIGIYPRPAV